MTFNNLCYQLADMLPDHERYNLSSQLKRAATSIALNIAEGSTGQSDAEQARFLSFAIRSHVEVIACMRLIEARDYLQAGDKRLQELEKVGAKLLGKLRAFKRSLS